MLSKESLSQQGPSLPPPFIVAPKKLNPPPSAGAAGAGLTTKDSLSFLTRGPVEGPVFVYPTLLGHPLESTLRKQCFLPVSRED